MAILLKDALAPNLVQSIERNAAFIHGGPFANIAHGCNSVIATKTALALSDVVVTEAGFGADLGAEKFLDIKCRQSGLRPDAVAVVATVRALKMHGGVAAADLSTPDTAAVKAGGENLRRHIENLQSVGLRPVVGINHFQSDSYDEVAVIRELCDGLDVPVAVCSHWAKGGKGAEDLGRLIADELERGAPPVELLYEDSTSLADKIRTVAARFYRAADINLSPTAARSLAEFEKLGFGDLPVCIAKTQYSFTADPKEKGAPTGHILPVREARLAAGAGFVVAICGDIMTMPGLPRHPAALDMSVDADGVVHGLS
ncbi:MAG: formate--tetrahydrofolate ligase, partial [Pseudomonadota bacterium]